MTNRLREARFFARKTQVQLWLETGIHFSTLSRMEGGYIDPAPEQLERLAKALHVKKSWLFPRAKANSRPSRSTFPSGFSGIELSASAKK